MTDLREVRKAIVLQAISRNFEHSEAMLRWCFTSLLALNGGALLALFGVDSLRANLVSGVGWKFGSGIFCAVISSFFLAAAYSFMATDLAEKVWKDDVLGRASFRLLPAKSVGTGVTATIATVLAIGSAWMLVSGSLDVVEALTEFEETK